MAEKIPENALDIVNKPALAHLATLMPDEVPQVTPVWFDYDGTYIRINTGRGRRKEKNMEERPQVGLDIVDPDDQYHWISIRGHVSEITEDGAVEHINKLSRKYLGHEYQAFVPGEVRVMCKIVPDRVVAQ
jgi:PPOX class probable F420-dependent enzyme